MRNVVLCGRPLCHHTIGAWLVCCMWWSSGLPGPIRVRLLTPHGHVSRRAGWCGGDKGTIGAFSARSRASPRHTARVVPGDQGRRLREVSGWWTPDDLRKLDLLGVAPGLEDVELQLSLRFHRHLLVTDCQEWGSEAAARVALVNSIRARSWGGACGVVCIAGGESSPESSALLRTCSEQQWPLLALAGTGGIVEEAMAAGARIFAAKNHGSELAVLLQVLLTAPSMASR